MPFIEKVSEYSDHRQKQIMAVNMNHDFFDLAVCSGGRLKLYNTFQYQGQLICCTSFCISAISLRWNPFNWKLVLSGELSDMMTYRDAIREYIPGAQTLKTRR